MSWFFFITIISRGAKKWPMVKFFWTYNNTCTVIYFEEKWVKLWVFTISVTLLFLNITLCQVSQGLWVGTVWTPEGQENFYFAIKVIQSLQTATMVTWTDLPSEWWISSKFSHIEILSSRLSSWCLRVILATLKGNW